MHKNLQIQNHYIYVNLNQEIYLLYSNPVYKIYKVIKF